MPTSNKKYPLRLDAPRKATGRAKYAADFATADTLHVALARAKVPHGIIRDIRIPPLPDGIVCFTAKDLPCNNLLSIRCEQPALAEDKVRFYGEPFAIVAASDRETAQKFADSISLEVYELPFVNDYIAALESDSAKLFDDGNLCYELHSCKGDPDAEFSNCSLVLEETFHVPTQCHGFLETETTFSHIDEQGRLAIVASTQNAFADRDIICKVLNRAPDTVHSMAAAVGGAFGGKDGGNTSQIFPAVVTHFTGRPAVYAFSREENIRFGLKRHRGTVHVKIGFDNSGLIRAFEGKMWLDTGAYAVLGPPVLELGVEHLTGPYYIPNCRLDGWLVYTNHAPSSAMRGFGGPQGAVAVESLVNLAAEKLSLSPVEIRRINALHEGQSGPMGAPMDHSVGFDKCVDLFEHSDFWHEAQENENPDIGYGVAGAMMSCGMGKGVPDSGIVDLEKCTDGHFVLRCGLVDIGQGSETILAMIAAEALHTDIANIEMVMANSDTTVDSGSTAASRTTYVAGNAVVKAAQMILSGADKAHVEEQFPELPTDDGIHCIFAFILLGVKVKVDRITGAVQVLDAYNVTEAGNIIHPDLLAGQIYGGLAMSTGYALSEEIRCPNGLAIEDGFNSYCMPTALDAPHMINHNVEFYEPTGPFGAKGMAEAATVAMAPAISAAVRDVCPGLLLHKFPINREEVLDYLSKEADL